MNALISQDNNASGTEATGTGTDTEHTEDTDNEIPTNLHRISSNHDDEQQNQSDTDITDDGNISDCGIANIDNSQHPQPVPASLLREFAAFCDRMEALRSSVLLNFMGFSNLLRAYDSSMELVRDRIDRSNDSGLRDAFVRYLYSGDDKPKIIDESAELNGDTVLALIMTKDFYTSQTLAQLLIQALCLTTLLTDQPDQQDFQCAICLNTFNRPVLLSCAHAFCFDCLAMAHQASIQNPQKQEACPICRKVQSLNPHDYGVHPLLNRVCKNYYNTSITPDKSPDVPPEDDNDDDTASIDDMPALSLEPAAAASADPTHIPDNTQNTLNASSTSDRLERRASRGRKKSSHAADKRVVPVSSSTAAASAASPSSPSAVTTASIPPLPHKSCSIFRLTKLQQLLSNHARKGTFIMLDLDETLVMTRHHSSLLLTSYGVRQFQIWVKNSRLDYSTKNKLVRALEAALKDKVCVEDDTPHVISELQDAGCWIFGLTARYPELASNTSRTLNSLGIDLTRTSPFPRTVIRDPGTNSLYCDGIIYCGGQPKGHVVSRFLENVTFAQLLQAAQAAIKEEETNQKNSKKNTNPDSPPSSGHSTPAQSPMLAAVRARSSSLLASPASSPIFKSLLPSSSKPSLQRSVSVTSPLHTYTPINPAHMTPVTPGVQLRGYSAHQTGSRTPFTPMPMPSPSEALEDALALDSSTPSARLPPTTPFMQRNHTSPSPILSSVKVALSRSVSRQSSRVAVSSSSSRLRSTPTTTQAPSLQRAMSARYYDRKSRLLRREDNEDDDIYQNDTDRERDRAKRRQSSRVTTPSTATATATISKARRTKRRRPLTIRKRVKHLLPPEIVFVDDQISNVNEVSTGIDIAKRLSIPVTCYCYVPHHLQSVNGQASTISELPDAPEPGKHLLLPRPAASNLFLKSSKLPNAALMSSASLPVGAPPAFGPMVRQKNEWFQ